MSGVFISYHRDDTQPLAGRLFDRLTPRFGKERVFRDIDAIEPAERFGQVIAERIGACDALVALIGKGWLDAKDAQGRRRLDLPDDPVKMEIAEALAQDKVVIPALVEGTAMPARDRLPPEIAALADRNALPISDSRFDFDVGRLISTIDKAIALRAAPHSGLWDWLSKRRTRRTLAFLAAGVAAVVGAAWTGYVYFAEKQKPPTSTVSAGQGGIAAGGNVSATAPAGGVAVVAAGPVTIGITLSEYEEKRKKREQELREEFTATSKSDKDKIALLERQLTAAYAQANSPEPSLEKYKKLNVREFSTWARRCGQFKHQLEEVGRVCAAGEQFFRLDNFTLLQLLPLPKPEAQRLSRLRKYFSASPYKPTAAPHR
jgi:hypothetical protein